jgi:hypothetical protein
MRLLDVVPAVQTSGIRGHSAQPRPHQVFLGTEEVTETPNHKSVPRRQRRGIVTLGQWRGVVALGQGGGVVALGQGRGVVALGQGRGIVTLW